MAGGAQGLCPQGADGSGRKPGCEYFSHYYLLADERETVEVLLQVGHPSQTTSLLSKQERPFNETGMERSRR